MKPYKMKNSSKLYKMYFINYFYLLLHKILKKGAALKLFENILLSNNVKQK